MLNEIKMGPRKQADGSTGEARGGEYSEAIVGQAHGKYYEAASRKKLFWCASQADTTWSIALHQTHTGLVVSNPRMSNVNLAIVRVGFALCVAPAGEASIGIFGGYDVDAELTHTTPLAVYNGYLLGPHGQANADAAATLPTAPLWIEAYMGGFTDATLPSTSPVIVDVDGAIIVPPGAYVGIGALTVVHAFASMMWEEIEI